MRDIQNEGYKREGDEKWKKVQGKQWNNVFLPILSPKTILWWSQKNMAFIWLQSLCLITSNKVLLTRRAFGEFQKSLLSRLDSLGESFINPNFNSIFFKSVRSWLSSSILEMPHGISPRASLLGELFFNDNFQSFSLRTRTLSKTHKKLINSKDLFTMNKILRRH